MVTLAADTAGVNAEMCLFCVDDQPLIGGQESSSAGAAAGRAAQPASAWLSQLSPCLWLLTFCSGIAGFLFGRETAFNH